MKSFLSFLTRVLGLWLRLLPCGLAEIFYILGNICPIRVAVAFWGLAVRLNRHHLGAALNRALAFWDLDDSRAVDSSLSVLEIIQNPWNTSASDLFLTWIPGRVSRNFAARLLWGLAAKDGLQKEQDRKIASSCKRLFTILFERAIKDANERVAQEALAACGSLGIPTTLLECMSAELDWIRKDFSSAISRLTEPIIAGTFISPLDTVRWARRFLDVSNFKLCNKCLDWAAIWIPEDPVVWQLFGECCWKMGEDDAARDHLLRAISLNPENVEAYIFLIAATRKDRTIPSFVPGSLLDVSTPTELTIGEKAPVRCKWQGSGSARIRVLAPAGWGILTEEDEYECASGEQIVINVSAFRPDRIRGAPWPLTFVCFQGDTYNVVRRAIRVRDNQQGQVLVVITEDHEIHEERGTLPVETIERLLIEKSRFASSCGVPWTHMVETGSVLSMTEWAGLQQTNWRKLSEDIRKHLADELRAGNDLQPHLHRFNDPVYSGFPYSVTPEGIKPTLSFLITSPADRGDWASATTGLERIKSVERCVLMLEEIGRVADSNYRAVLWRSGLLDYGENAADYAWSTVALRRSGILADSDLGKPFAPLETGISPAFFASWEQPFRPQPGGAILQLPVVANLEGDYLMNRVLLARRARKLTAKFMRLSGTHLFTLLTHEKFINARKHGKEFTLDRNYGDWVTIQKHIAAWRRAGAKFVTAREGIETIVHENSWRLVALMDAETFVLSAERTTVRYRVTFLGKDIPVSERFPQHVILNIPPVLRGQLRSVTVTQNGSILLKQEMNVADTCFWLVVADIETPVYCSFSLTTSVAPELGEITRHEDGGFKIGIKSALQFLSCSIILPYKFFPRDQEAGKVRVLDANRNPVSVVDDEEGFLLKLNSLEPGVVKELTIEPSDHSTISLIRT